MMNQNQNQNQRDHPHSSYKEKKKIERSEHMTTLNHHRFGGEMLTFMQVMRRRKRNV
jgi:hypothetical protein